MTDDRNSLNDWFEDDGPGRCADLSAPGLPPALQHYLWWIPALIFAGLWLFESLDVLQAEPDLSGYSHFGANLLSLALCLGLCYTLFRLCSPLTRGIAYMLSGSGAVYVLLTHTF